MRSTAFLLTLALMFPTHAPAEQLTLDRIFANPSLSGETPRSLKLSPDGQRVTFLQGRTDEQQRLDLWVYELDTGQTRMLVDSRRLTGGVEQLSDEEKARRERQRTADLRGIAEYAFSADGQRLLFPLAGDLYVYDLDADEDQAVRQIARAEDGFVTDPRFSPQGHYVSFVRDQNLFVVDLEDSAARALTDDGGGLVSWGMAEFVAQEEMDRDTGYWWSPDEAHIAATRVDEASVPLVRRFEIHADRTEVIEQRYPAVGDPNVRIQLAVIALADGQKRWVDLGQETDVYLPRVNWLPGGKALSYQRQSRDQRRLELIRVELDQNLSQRTLLEERRDTWVNLHHALRFLDARGRFIWASEHDGQQHLYLHAPSGRRQRAITRGEWQVDSLLAVDNSAKRVYFLANADDPLARDVYVQDLDPLDARKPRRLTQGGWSDAVFADDASTWLHTWSDPEHPPQVRLRDRQGRVLKVISANEIVADHPYAPYQAAHGRRIYGSVKAADGQDLYYQLLLPAGHQPGQRHPAVVRVYGGPHAQVVQKRWDERWGLFDQYLAQQGFVVYSLDNRGSARRGTEFENPIHRQMGGPEVIDQQQGMRWLAEQDFVDPDRLGVVGWSYGGYMALHLWARTPSLTAAVAVAPVTDWRLYDTHYTERYMDLPSNNADGYAQSNVLNWLERAEGGAEALSDRLLLIHGMADDNVLFSHSTGLISAMVEQQIRFSLMAYPGGKHGINATPAMRRHVFGEIARYFEQTLHPAQR
ncbi:MAG: S9 family peptidase [Lysobacterales bacterium]